MKIIIMIQKKKKKKKDIEDDNKEITTKTAENIILKLYVARAQKRKERAENLRRASKKKGRSGRSYPGTNLYIKNLSPDIDDDKLKSMFENYGTITSAKVMVDAQTNKSRGFGFVAFEKKKMQQHVQCMK